MRRSVTRGEFLFFCAYILWLLVSVVKLTYLKSLMPYKEISNIAENIVLLLLALKLMGDEKFTVRDWIGIVVLTLINVIAANAEMPMLFMTVFFIFSARNIDLMSIFKITFIVQMSIMVITVSCALGGIIPNESWDEGARQRLAMGYTFCTYGSHIFFFLSLNYMVLRKKINALEVLGLLVGNYVWYMLTDTRIDLLLSFLAIILVYAWQRMRKIKWNNVGWSLLLGNVGVLAAIASIVVQWFYNESNAILFKVNQILNARIWYGWLACKTYGITLLGQAIKWVGRGGIKKDPYKVYNYVDSSFLKFFLNYGLIFFIFLLLGLVIAGIYVQGYQNKALAVAFVFWIIYGMVDAELLELAFHPFMFLLSSCFSQQWRIE